MIGEAAYSNSFVGTNASLYYAIDSASEAFDGVIGGVLMAPLVLSFEFALQPGPCHHQVGDAAQQPVDAFVVVNFASLGGHALARLLLRCGILCRCSLTQFGAPLRGEKPLQLQLGDADLGIQIGDRDSIPKPALIVMYFFSVERRAELAPGSG